LGNCVKIKILNILQCFSKGDILIKNIIIGVTTLSIFGLLGCQSEQSNIELLSANVEIVNEPSSLNYEVTVGEEVVLPEKFLEYAFVISNTGDSVIGGENTLDLLVEFKPGNQLIEKFSEEMFYSNPVNSYSGTTVLQPGKKEEFIFVYGMDERSYGSENSELLNGEVVIKYKNKVIKRFNLNDVTK
jgi:archaellum component FlaG (FlaF/FlaG flagellin family)